MATAALAAGIVSGGVAFLGRSAHREEHVDGTAAWWPHLALFLGAIVLVTIAARRGGPGSVQRLLLAPLGVTAAARLGRTRSAARNHPGAALRLLVSVLPLAVLLFLTWRVGEQVLNGLDPNFTANAWGGPGYPGAMACHYLDSALLMAASSGLLNVLLLPSKSDGE